MIDLEGLWILQSHPGEEGAGGEDLGAKTIARAARAVGLDEIGRPKIEAFGDLTGAVSWSAQEGYDAPPREANAWSFAMPAVTAQPLDGGPEVNAVPLYDHLVPDGRFDLKVVGLPNAQRHRFRLPTGWPGLVVDGTDEGREAPIFFPAGGVPLVAASADPARGRPEVSSIVSDVLPSGSLDPEATGSLSDTHQVIRGVRAGVDVGATRTQAQQQAAEEADALALNFDPRHGLGLLAYADKGGPERAAVQLSGGTNPVFSRPPAREFDAYRLGETLDGYDVTPARLSTQALWRGDGFSGLLEGPLRMSGFLPGGTPPASHDEIVQGAILWTETGEVVDGVPKGEWRVYSSSAWGDSPHQGDHPRPTTGSPLGQSSVFPNGIPQQTGTGDPFGRDPLPQPFPENSARPKPGPRPGGGGGPVDEPGLPPFQPWGPGHPGWGSDKPPRPPKPGEPGEGEIIVNGERRDGFRPKPPSRIDSVPDFDGLAGAALGGAIGTGAGSFGQLPGGAVAGGAASELYPPNGPVPIPTQCTSPNKALNFPTSRRAIRVPGMRVRAQPYGSGQEDVSGWSGPISDFLKSAIDNAPDVVAMSAYGAGGNTWTNWGGTRPKGNQPAVASGGLLLHSPDVRPCDVINNGASGTETAWLVHGPNAGAEHVGGSALGFGQPSTTTGGLKSGTSMQAIDEGLLIRSWADDTDLDENLLFTTAGNLQFGLGAGAIFQSPDGNSTGSIVMSDSGTLGIGIGADKVQIPGFLDPTGLGLTAQGSRPSQLDGSTYGLWVSSTGPTLYWWDGTSSTDIGAGSGGGDHDVSDAGTNNVPVAVDMSHTTSSTSTTGFGVARTVTLEDASGNADTVHQEVFAYTTATDGSEDVDYVLSTMYDGTLFEWLRWDASLSALRLDGPGDSTAGTINGRVGYFRAVDDGNTPVDGWGGQWGLALQRTSGAVQNVADLEWWYTDVSAQDSAIGFVALDGGTGIDLLQLFGGAGTVRLPNGILEFADQDTLGTPATGYGRLGYDVTADSARPRFVDQAGTETSLALLSDTGGGGGDHDVSDAGTTNMVDAVDLSHTTSGTPAAGFGVRQTYTLDNELGSPEEVGSIEVLWAGAVGGSTDMEFYALANGSPTRLLYLDGSELRTVSTVDDANTNSVSIPATVEHTCSGTPASGFGVGWQFFLENATDGFADYAAQIHAEFGNSAASGSEDVDLVLSVCRDGNWGSTLTEGLRIDADGDGAGGTSTTVLATQGRFDLAEQTSPGTPPAGRMRLFAHDGQRTTPSFINEDGNEASVEVLEVAEAAESSTSSGTETDLESSTVKFIRDNDLAVIHFAFRGSGSGGGSGGTYRLKVNGTTVFTISATFNASMWVHGQVYVQRTATQSRVWGSYRRAASSGSQAVAVHQTYYNESFGDISSASGITIKCTGQQATATYTIRSQAWNVEKKGGNG